MKSCSQCGRKLRPIQEYGPHDEPLCWDCWQEQERKEKEKREQMFSPPLPDFFSEVEHGQAT